MLLDLFFPIINTNVQVKLRKKTMKQHARAANGKPVAPDVSIVKHLSNYIH